MDESNVRRQKGLRLSKGRILAIVVALTALRMVWNCTYKLANSAAIIICVEVLFAIAWITVGILAIRVKRQARSRRQG